MKKLLVLLVFIAAMAFVSGCGTTIKMSGADYEPRDSHMVKIIYEVPKEPYEVIAKVSISKYMAFPPGAPKPSNMIMKEIRKRTAKLGGEAFISTTEDFSAVSGLVITFGSKPKVKKDTDE